MSGCYPGYDSNLGQMSEFIDKMYKEIIELRNRIEGLHANKLQQIDLNKKANERIKKLEKFDEFNNEFFSILKHRIEKLEALQDSMLHTPNLVWQKYCKTPFKCPVCDGCGNDKGTRESNPNYDFCMKYASCHACEGKGIVWG